MHCLNISLLMIFSGPPSLLLWFHSRNERRGWRWWRLLCEDGAVKVYQYTAGKARDRDQCISTSGSTSGTKISLVPHGSIKTWFSHSSSPRLSGYHGLKCLQSRSSELQLSLRTNSTWPKIDVHHSPLIKHVFAGFPNNGLDFWLMCSSSTKSQSWSYCNLEVTSAYSIHKELIHDCCIVLCWMNGGRSLWIITKIAKSTCTIRGLEVVQGVLCLLVLHSVTWNHISAKLLLSAILSFGVCPCFLQTIGLSAHLKKDDTQYLSSLVDIMEWW